MNPQAMEELLNLIMTDDFVARRRGLDLWCRRWLAEMQVVGEWREGGAEARRHAAESMRRTVYNGLMEDPFDVLKWVDLKDPDGTHGLVLTLHCIKQVPLEVK